MSKVLKKLVSGVKKVFKKIVNTAKKIVKSDFFKIAVAAVAIYFTAGAAAGMMGGASAAAGSGVAAGAASATASTAATAGAAFAPGAAAAAANATASTKILGTLASAGKAVGAAASNMTAGQQLLASTALTTGGNMLSAYGKGKQEEEYLKERDRNSKHNLNVYGNWHQTLNSRGYGQDAAGLTTYDAPQNVENAQPQFYDNANDKWAPIQKTAGSSVSAPTANARNV